MVNYIYDKNNRLTGVTDAEGQTMQYQYAPNGNILSAIRPGIATTYEYNKNGQPTKIKYQLSNTTCMEDRITYDILGRVIGSERTGTSPEFTRNITYTYDALGRLRSYQKGQNTAIMVCT